MDRGIIIIYFCELKIVVSIIDPLFADQEKRDVGISEVNNYAHKQYQIRDSDSK